TAPNVTLLQIVGTVHDQSRPDQPQGKAVDRAGDISAGHFLGHDRLFHRPRVLAAVFTGPAHADEAGVVQLALPRLFLRERVERPSCMLSKPLAGTLSKCLVLG